jgi:Outer membrane protein beta-barrel domain
MMQLSRSFIPLAMIAVGVPATLAAQAAFGLKGGASFATLSNKAPDWKSRTGFVVGAALDLRSGLIGIQPEVLYVQKGVNFDGTPTSAANAPRLGYIDVPILIKLTIPTPGIQPMFYAGPSVSFRLSCSFNGVDCNDATTSTDYGAVLGGGVRFGGSHGFTVEGRYTWGLKDIHDPGAGIKNETRTFLLLAGISL